MANRLKPNFKNNLIFNEIFHKNVFNYGNLSQYHNHFPKEQTLLDIRQKVTPEIIARMETQRILCTRLKQMTDQMNKIRTNKNANNENRFLRI